MQNLINNINEILIILCGLYVFLSIALTFGILRKGKRLQGELPGFSIVIPARNEEKNIGRCLESISALDYPSDKVEILVIDDRSTDRTAEICESFAEELASRFSRFSVLRRESGKPGGKQAALAEGIRQTGHEIIIQTDADCSVPPTWLRSIASRFNDRTGIVGGITILDEFEKSNSCFTQIQSLDWTYLLGVGVGANGIGVPLSCIGNNLAVRRKAYDDAGGYEGIPFSLTEDFALFKAVIQAGWKAAFSVEEESLVLSSPPEGIGGFLNQRTRWAVGGIRVAGPGVILLAEAFVFHLALKTALFFGAALMVWISVIVVKSVFDYVFLRILLKKLNRRKLLNKFVLFEFYYILYTTLFGLIFPWITAVQWKDRRVSTA